MPLVTDDQVKDHLNKPNMSAEDLAELQGMIAAAEGIVISRVGDVDEAIVVETHAGGSLEIALERDPVKSVTSVLYVADDSTAVTAADIGYDEDAGVIWRKSGAPFPCGRLKTTYVVARDDPPAEFAEACLIIIKHLWETQRGRGGVRTEMFGVAGEGSANNGAEAGYVYRGYAIPNRAIQLLAHHTRPGIA